MELSKREVCLITNGLYLLESQLYADEVHFEMADEIGPTEPEEVGTLMEKIGSCNSTK